MTEPFTFLRPKMRVAAVGGMMAYFESILPGDFRAERRRHVASVTGQLGEEFELIDLGLWAESADTPDLAKRMAEAKPDVVLLVPTMATPPEDLAHIAAEARAPVVIACAHELAEITTAYDMAELCRHSCNVGATMLGSMLRRLDTPIDPVLVTGFLDEQVFHDRISMALRAAGIARRLSGLRVAKMGDPMPGYAHVGLSKAQADAFGVELVDVPIELWRARIAEVTSAEIDAFFKDDLRRLTPDSTQMTRTDDLDAAMRMAIALDRVAEELQLDCGSLACRGPYGVGLDTPSIGCLATSLMTTTYRPFSATGDLVTAIAMWVGKALGGATLYCELDAVDRNRDAFLVANTGEGDFGWVPEGGKCIVRDSGAHSGRAVPGVVTEHDMTAGLATMIGVTLDRTRSEKPVLIALGGETLEPAKTGLKVTNGWFQTARRPALSAFEAWANAGATHHGALSRGDLGEALAWISQLSGWPLTQISKESEAYHD